MFKLSQLEEEKKAKELIVKQENDKVEEYLNMIKEH